MLFTVAHVEPYNHPMIGNGFLALKTGPYCSDSACAEHPADHHSRNQNQPGAQGRAAPVAAEKAEPALGSTQNTLGGLHLAGVFNGLSNHTPSHRARLPALFNYQLALPADAAAGDTLFYVGAALDVQRAIFFNRTRLTTAACSADIEQRWYAHRLHKHILVHELEVRAAAPRRRGNSGGDATGSTAAAAAGCQLALARLHLDWSDIDDLDMTVDAQGVPAVATGCTRQVEIPGYSNVTCVGLAWDALPATIDASSSATYRYLLAARTAVEEKSPTTPAELGALAKANYTAAHAISPPELMASHTAAWAELWQAGFEMEGNATVARSVNSSLYYILCNLREDVPQGLSPGGLATDSYSGHSFWDTETWMYPALSPLYPQLGRSLLQYRLDRVPGAKLHAQWQSECGGRGVGG